MVEWCTYAFGTNTTLGRQRMATLDAHMRRIELSYTPEVARRSVSPFVPCLEGRHGYIGVWRSTHHLWKKAERECRHEWTLLLESDALLPANFRDVAQLVLRPPAQIVWFDARTGFGSGPSGCCTNAVAYRRDALPLLVRHFDPSNRVDALWNNYSRRRLPVVQDPTCLTDWYLANVAATAGLVARRHGVVAHPSNDKNASEIASSARW